MLGLEATYQEKKETNGMMKDKQDKIDQCRSTELSLTLKTEQLQKQLKEDQLNSQKLGEFIELIQTQVLKPLGIDQICK